MNELILALNALGASLEAAARLRQLYNTMREQAQRTGALTDAQSAELDQRAEDIFNSPAAKESGI